LFALCLGGAALAAMGSVSISAPAKGATLDAAGRHAITYAVDPGPQGDHVHLYDNGRQTAIVRKLKGSHDLGTLEQGPHELCIKVVTAAHVPTGVQDCVEVKVQ
jgi:hypothetical protein